MTYEAVDGGGIEQCRGLCDELMAFQRSKATMEPERFDAMDFDTRMRKSYDAALERQVVVAKDDGAPVGYVFSTVESREDMRSSPFRLLPERGELPSRIGCISNLYLREGYRGGGIGSALVAMALEWLDGFDDVDLVYVFISNGNDSAYDFYIRHGFAYSHDVLGGFIRAVCRRRGTT